MSGAQIAAEVNAALLEVAVDVGDGEFLVTLQEPTSAPRESLGCTRRFASADTASCDGHGLSAGAD